MPSQYYQAGDLCFCNVYICNNTENTLTENPLFVILDVFGSYFFAPDFKSYDFYSTTFPPGETKIEVLPEFKWPEGAGSAGDIKWYAAMTNPEITELYGEMDTWSFGWGD